jgi:hypothetical protein
MVRHRTALCQPSIQRYYSYQQYTTTARFPPSPSANLLPSTTIPCLQSPSLKPIWLKFSTPNANTLIPADDTKQFLSVSTAASTPATRIFKPIYDQQSKKNTYLKGKSLRNNGASKPQLNSKSRRIFNEEKNVI